MTTGHGVAQASSASMDIKTAVRQAEERPVFQTQLAIYPNPFSEATTIQIDHIPAGQAKIEIYAASGQFVRRLNFSTNSSSKIAVKWDGRDDRGRRLPNGIYFISLQTKAGHFSHKICLLR